MRSRFLLSIAASDLLALAVGLVAASLTVFGTWLPWTAQPRIWPLLGFMAGGLAIGSYISARTWGKFVPRPSYGRALTIFGTAVASSALGVLVSRAYWSRPFILVSAAVWVTGMMAHRLVRRRRPWTESMMIVTSQKGLVDDLRMAQHANVIGLLDPRDDQPPGPLPPGVTLVVDLREVLSDRMAQFVSSCNLAGVPVRSLASVYEEHTGRLPIVHLAEGWELSTPVERSVWFGGAKRVVDVAIVVMLAPVAVLLCGFVAAAVLIDSGAPVLFRQVRVGRAGSRFTLIKFRTMAVDAELNGPRFAEERDTRFTRIGRRLRKSRLDELPQLWNVLKGDLSLVGPRPEQPVFAEHFEQSIPFYGHRHLVRPGITGWAQVNYGYADDEADTIEKLSYDLYYVKNMSPWTDINILGQSIWTVVSGFGAR